MKKHLPARLSPALVISVLALFVALGGSSYAATSGKATTHSLRYTKASLLNAWAWGGFGTNAAGYAKDPSRVVHFRGSVGGGAADTVAFTLPAADRPSHTLYFTMYTEGGTTGTVQVANDGSVLIDGANAHGFASLDGITFSAK
jgi:hypothetical protein